MTLSKSIAIAFLLGILFGVTAGYFIGNLKIGLFLFGSIFFLIGVGHYWDSIEQQYSTQQIGGKSFQICRFKPWRLSFFPLVMVNIVIDIIFAYLAMGGDPYRWLVPFF